MPLTEERRRRWRITVAATVFVVFLVLIIVAVLAWIDWSKKPGPNELLGMLGAVVSLALAAIALPKWALRRRPPPAAPTDTMIIEAKTALAHLVQQQWKDEARIRALGDPQPIPVAWQLTGKRALMDHPHLIAEGELAFSGTAEDLRALAGQFRALRSRRLIITGGPGTGKTTLALQLLLELLATRTNAEPVPVMLSIAGWDTSRCRRLDAWLAAQLAAAYPTLRAAEYGGDTTPHTLTANGHILPILDGLDELPTLARAQVITALNESLTENDQLILTSRTTEFATAVQAAGDVVTGAAVIAPTALTPSIAATYLRTCLPPTPCHDWEPALEAIGSGTAPALAVVTATPLGLWLIRMVYILPNADPAPLLGPLGQDLKALRSHLLDHLVDALIHARPPITDPGDPRGPFRPHRSWDPGQARAWLSHVARALTRNHTRDLTWWTIARYTTTPAQRRLLRAMVGITIGLVVALTCLVVMGVSYIKQRNIGVQLGVQLGFVAWIWTWLKAKRWFDELPGFTDRRLALSHFPSIRTIGLGIVVVSVVTLLGTVLFLVASSMPKWVLKSQILAVIHLLGVAGGCAIISSAWVRQMERPTPLTSSTSASSTWRADRNLTLARTLAAAYTFGVLTFLSIIGVVFVLNGGTITGAFTQGLALGIVGGLFGGFVGGLTSGHHRAWLACTITLLTQRRLPRRLIPFLDDMHRLGLLRTVGPLYQFRHAELHDHLAAADTSGGTS
ncbi:NACHT domain-containing protein [Nonomuraea sp. NPDC050153]|uniref:NACHT domain-containing protein n=1 Tax=Nonomuraea sp. NPDC050153 TaxID=3364359 RepID=UPI00379A3DA6